MITVIKLILHGNHIANVMYNERRGCYDFQYTDNFINKGVEPSPIMMPVREGMVYRFNNLGEETFKGLPGLLADSLPDTYGRALFEQWLRVVGRTSSNTLESLCFMGKRCMGALEFEPSVETSVHKDKTFEIESLIDVASRALNEKESFATNINDNTAIADILQLGTSAGGQRAKAVIAYNKNTGEIRSGQIEAPKDFDYYLIKLDGVNGSAGLKDTNNYGRIEYSFSELTRKCGINISECGLIEENGRAHFITKRFDRQEGKKVHMQTLCGIAHMDYRLRMAYSYEQAFEVMRGLHLPYSDIIELFKRIVLNIIIRNNDDHTKNISFLMDEEGTWRLSPAYDVGFAYNPNGLWTRTHQMSINGKFDNINRRDLLELAANNGIKHANQIIEQISDVASNWRNIAINCGVPQTKTDRIYNLFDFLA